VPTSCPHFRVKSALIATPTASTSESYRPPGTRSTARCPKATAETSTAGKTPKPRRPGRSCRDQALRLPQRPLPEPFSGQGTVREERDGARGAAASHPSQPGGRPALLLQRRLPPGSRPPTRRFLRPENMTPTCSQNLSPREKKKIMAKNRQTRTHRDT
jgi:hypothetical protein